MKIQARTICEDTVNHLISQGVEPALARLYVARGVTDVSEVTYTLENLLPLDSLTNCREAATYLANKIEEGAPMIIVADYDCDGATACAVAYRTLEAYGADIHYLVPDRLVHGYGLTSTIVDLVSKHEAQPKVIITVDNGIASIEGIAYAKNLGIEVLVTDHHLPGETAPDAVCIVNPNQRGCEFKSKAMAGCGVMYYVALALEQELAARDFLPFDSSFTVSSLLPIVAVGTIADVVTLDHNNRILVSHGLSMIRERNCAPGILELARVAGVDLAKLNTTSIAFGVGPRINAAGRLQSMTVGIECLITNDPENAVTLATALNAINEERKGIEKETVEQAADQLVSRLNAKSVTLVLHEPQWHEGVIGIAAGRIKEKMYRPTFVLTTNEEGNLKGSGRSIPGFHLRDALDLVSKKDPSVLLKFGGHAMAAGVTVHKDKLDRFKELFEEVGNELLDESALEQIVLVDPALPPNLLTVDSVTKLKSAIWGQGFVEPLFSDNFKVASFNKMGKDKNHSRFALKKDGYLFNGVKFRHDDTSVHCEIEAVYKIDVNTFRDNSSVQLLVEHIFSNEDSELLMASR